MARFRALSGRSGPYTYAYPAGKYDDTTFAIMRQLGIRAAFTEIPGAVTSLQKPYVLPRRRIHRDDSLAAFGAVATP